MMSNCRNHAPNERNPSVFTWNITRVHVCVMDEIICRLIILSVVHAEADLKEPRLLVPVSLITFRRGTAISLLNILCNISKLQSGAFRHCG